MIKLINRRFGNEMWVADDRVDEYLAAGHVLAAEVEEPEEKPTKTAKPVKARKTKEAGS